MLFANFHSPLPNSFIIHRLETGCEKFEDKGLPCIMSSIVVRTGSVKSVVPVDTSNSLPYYFDKVLVYAIFSRIDLGLISDLWLVILSCGCMVNDK